MITDEHDLETWLRRTADAVEPPHPVAGEDVRRGARALRRRRAGVAAGSLAALAVVGAAGTAVPWSSADDRSSGPATDGPASPTAVPSRTERAPGTGRPENRVAERVVLDVLDPEGRFASLSDAWSEGGYADDGRLVSISPMVDWVAPGMDRPGTVEVRVARSGGDVGWQCSRACGTLQLDGRDLQTGLTDAGTPTWSYVQADGDRVAILLYDFPNGVTPPVERIERLLTSPALDVPDLRLAAPVAVHRAIIGAASEVASGGWNVRTVGERESDTWLDAIAQQDGRDHGLVRIEVEDATDAVGTCGDDLVACRVDEVEGLTVRRGAEVDGPYAGWLRVETDRAGHRVRVLLQPRSAGTPWSIPEELARRVLLSGAWSALG